MTVTVAGARRWSPDLRLTTGEPAQVSQQE